MDSKDKDKKKKEELPGTVMVEYRDANYYQVNQPFSLPIPEGLDPIGAIVVPLQSKGKHLPDGVEINGKWLSTRLVGRGYCRGLRVYFLV